MLRIKKSQSSFELFVILLVFFVFLSSTIGILFHFNFFSFISLLPDECEFSSNIDCVFANVIDESESGLNDAKINILLRNNLGVNVEVSRCFIYLMDSAGRRYICSDANGICGNKEFNLVGQTWYNEEDLLFSFNQCDISSYGIHKGMKTELHAIIEYSALETPDNYLHNITGLIYTRIN